MAPSHTPSQLAACPMKNLVSLPPGVHLPFSSDVLMINTIGLSTVPAYPQLSIYCAKLPESLPRCSKKGSLFPASLVLQHLFFGCNSWVCFLHPGSSALLQLEFASVPAGKLAE